MIVGGEHPQVASGSPQSRLAIRITVSCCTATSPLRSSASTLTVQTGRSATWAWSGVQRSSPRLSESSYRTIPLGAPWSESATRGESSSLTAISAMRVSVLLRSRTRWGLVMKRGGPAPGSTWTTTRALARPPRLSCALKISSWLRPPLLASLDSGAQ